MDFASSNPSSRPEGAPSTGRVLGVIPARLASSRLPRKPLHPLLGRPLVAWAWERANGMEILDRVVVAADDGEVAEVCRRAGASVVMTDPGHPSGTDRIAEVVSLHEFEGYDIIVNLQGDEPLLDEAHVAAAVEEVWKGRDVGTCGTPVGDLEAWRTPSVVKVVLRADGTALYFSRAPIPHRRDGDPETDMLAGPPYLRHLGLYAYRRAALLRWVDLPPSPLEELERLEQLRALEAGLTIGVSVVDRAESGVDTPDDAARMEHRMRELGIGR